MSAPPIMMYGCGACKERFATRDEMKQHFSTPFHTYNAERKAKGFSPVDYPTFKALAVEDEQEPDAAPKFYCKICKKYYNSVHTLTAHLKSKAHLANKQKAIEDGASTVASTASKFLLGSKSVSSKANTKKATLGIAGATPSAVLHLKNVPVDAVESDLQAMLTPYGKVQRVELQLRKKVPQALVQMDSVESAKSAVTAFTEGKCQLTTANHTDTAVVLQYSKHEDLSDKTKTESVCNLCKAVGHVERHCPERKCAFCKQMGHGKQDCPDVPCVACKRQGHNLKTCEHRKHYETVIKELRTVTEELRDRMAAVNKQLDEEEAAVEAGDTMGPAVASPVPAEEFNEEIISEAEKRRNWVQACACLFCNHVALDPEGAMVHMREQHAFQIPVEDVLVDQNGLLAYLQRKVRAGLCLYCNEHTKFFTDIYTLRKHMIDKSHTHINWTEHVDEYAQFYDLPESTAWTPEADEDGRAELPSGRVLTQRSGRVHHEHRPGDWLMISGKETDAERRKLLLTYKKEQGAVVATGAKAALSRGQYNKLVKQDTALQNKRNKMWVKVATDHNRQMFHGYMV